MTLYHCGQNRFAMQCNYCDRRAASANYFDFDFEAEAVKRGWRIDADDIHACPKCSLAANDIAAPRPASRNDAP
jgi:hypothetical protein